MKDAWQLYRRAERLEIFDEFEEWHMIQVAPLELHSQAFHKSLQAWRAIRPFLVEEVP